MNKSRPGDIILFKFDKRYWYARPWAAIISWITGSRYTHAAILIDKAHGGVIIEAYYPTVRKILLENSFWDNMYSWESWRPIKAGILTQKNVANKAEAYMSVPYDVDGLISLAKEFILSGILNYKIRRKSKLKNHNSKWFCSELVDQCYKDAGFTLDASLPEGSMAPMDFTNPEKFELIETSRG